MRQLSSIELPVFSSDPLQYPLWRNAIMNLVNNKDVYHTTKLHFLSKSMTGSPKRSVEDCLLLDTSDA